MTNPLAPEIIWFTPSESYFNDPINTFRAVSKAASARGLLGIYHGIDEQDSSVGVWVLVWKSLAVHQSFMEHETYTDFALTVMEAMAGPGEITQVVFSEPSEFLEAASSPITQFIYVTLRPRHDRGYELAPLVEELANGLKQVPGCYGTSWAPSDEHDNMYIGVTGWRSISDRNNAVNGVLAPTITQIRELGTVELKYARLQLYKP